MTDYTLYVDDSGDQEMSLWSGLLFPNSRWSDYLHRWLQFRRTMYRKHGLPARYELHAYKWIPKKDLVLPDQPEHVLNRDLALRRTVARQGLQTINSMEELRVITCRADTAVKADAYDAFITETERLLAAEGDRATVVVDGDPTNPDPRIKRRHRELVIHDRRVLEDGWTQSSSDSQLLQMADLVAHAAYQAHHRDERRRFMWTWYSDFIHGHEMECACPDQ